MRMRESQEHERRGCVTNRSILWESKRGEKIWYGQKVLVIAGGIGFIGSKSVLNFLQDWNNRSAIKQRSVTMILVTGGTGYIGSVLVRELLALGETVRVVDTQWFDSSFDAHERLELIEADLRHCDTASLLDDVSGIVHLAGLSNDPTADFAPDLNSESN